MNRLNNLDYIKFNTTNPGVYKDICKKCFSFWHNSWIGTFNNLGVEGKSVKSDDFLDRDVVVLLDGEEPVGLVFLRSFDMTRDSSYHHSYFDNYPKEVLNKIEAFQSESVVSLSYMTVHQDWRFSMTDLPIVDLLFSLAMSAFIESTSDALIGYIRTDKVYYKSFYRHGLKKISSSKSYNVPVDYCFVNRLDARLSDIKEIAEIALHLTSNNIKAVA